MTETIEATTSRIESIDRATQKSQIMLKADYTSFMYDDKEKDVSSSTMTKIMSHRLTNRLTNTIAA